jgi:hypothetical protein
LIKKSSKPFSYLGSRPWAVGKQIAFSILGSCCGSGPKSIEEKAYACIQFGLVPSVFSFNLYETNYIGTIKFVKG